jgi:teichuronic acid biosynthesis glycosyltransferase TuaG
MLSYNHGRFLTDTIKSVINQSFDDFELIVIDDASSDNSREIITDFQRIDSRIKPIFHEKNMGIARTTNDGLKKALGKYIAFIDSDDLWERDKLEAQISILNKNDDLIVCSEGEIIDKEGNPTGGIFTEIHGAPDKKRSGHIFESLLKGNYILESSAIMSRKNIENIVFCDKLSYHNDWLFFIELSKHHEYFFIDKALVKYRIHGQNTNTDVRGYLKDYIKTNKIFISDYRADISREIRSSLYANIAGSYMKLGFKLHAYFYASIGFSIDPHNLKSKNKLVARLKVSYYFLYLIMKKITSSFRS